MDIHQARIEANQQEMIAEMDTWIEGTEASGRKFKAS
jgi:hypothetical protein